MNKKDLLKSIKELKKLYGKDRDLEESLDELKTLVENDESLKNSSKKSRKIPLEELTLPEKIEGKKNTWALFSDGACRGNPGPGAWASIGQDNNGNVVFESAGVDIPTTNNRMELMGAIKAIEILKDVLDEEKKSIGEANVYLYSDSKYVVEGMRSWIRGWKERGWKKADKKEPENVDLWKSLDAISTLPKSLKFEWVKGHSGHPQNERCDFLANEALDEAGH